MDVTLYYAPGSCAQVALTALEEIGAPYTLKPIAFMRGDHKQADFLAINPKAKVPALVAEGHAITENVAILTWLANTFPDARLLPSMTTDLKRAEILSDLSFFASGLHPIVTRLRIPQYFCDLPETQDRVFDMAEAAMRPNLAYVNARLENQPWWYEDGWSLMDAYLNWVWYRVSGTRFDVSDFANLARHDAASAKRPSVARARDIRAREDAALEKQGLAVRFDGENAVKAP